jgi:uncharacterized repeat protein (TIGR02543 family)
MQGEQSMKKTIVLVLAAACLGLLLACPDPEPTPSPGPGTTEYTVTFDKNCTDSTVTAPSARKVKKDDPVGSLPVLTRSGYTLGGWYDTAAGTGTKYDAAFKVTKDITMYAKWDPIPAGAKVVTYYENKTTTDDTVLYTKTVLATENNVGTLPAVPTRSGFTFSKWTIGRADTTTEFTATTAVTTAMSVYAQWTAAGPSTVTVSFDTNGGSPATITSIQVAPGGTGGNSWPPDPTKASNTFGGWYVSTDPGFTPPGAWGTAYTSTSTISAALSLKAKWVSSANATTITFNSNAPATDEVAATAASPATMTVEGTIGTLPTPPKRWGWGAGYAFAGWYTEASGGTAVTATTTLTPGTTTLYAHWGAYAAGTPEVVGQTLVTYAPPLTDSGSSTTQQGAFEGTNDATTGIAEWNSGAARYVFPADVSDYDFLDLEYIGVGPNANRGFKIGETGNDYNLLGEDTNTPGTISGPDTFNFSIRTSFGNATGVALQIWSPGAEGKIKWTNATFRKGVRHNVTFAMGYEGAPAAPTGITAIEDVVIGPLPTPAARDGFNFAGWLLPGGTDAISAATVITQTADFTLTAKWTVKVSVTPKAVNFSTASVTASGGGSVTGITATSYTFTYGTGSNNDYGNAYASFRFDLGAATLADYSTVTFDYKGEGGDVNSKQLVLRLIPAATGYLADDTRVVTNSLAVTGTTLQTNRSLTINKTSELASSTGNVIFCFYIHAGASSGTTSYTISNVTFNP